VRDKVPNDDPQYPLLTNQPDALVMDPVRRVRIGVLFLAVAIVLGSGVSAYFATATAGAKTDQHSQDLLNELNRRTAERRANEAVQAAILEQNRRTLCEVIPGVVPTSTVHQEKLVQLKKAYRCGTAKDALVPPGWSPPPGWPPLPPGPDGFTVPTTVPPTIGGRPNK
jgi:hypothetical protein